MAVWGDCVLRMQGPCSLSPWERSLALKLSSSHENKPCSTMLETAGTKHSESARLQVRRDGNSEEKLGSGAG